MSNLKNLISDLYGNQIQELEDKFREMLFRLDIDTMEGLQLDNLGTILGQDRLGYDDTNFRVLLKVRIGINNSEGDIERILTIWKLLAGTDDVELHELFPAGIKLISTTYIGDVIGELLIELLQGVTGAGISLKEIMIDDPLRFGWGPTRGFWGTDFVTVYSA